MKSLPGDEFLAYVQPDSANVSLVEPLESDNDASEHKNVDKGLNIDEDPASKLADILIEEGDKGQPDSKLEDILIEEGD